jgi:hypothetical protein
MNIIIFKIFEYLSNFKVFVKLRKPKIMFLFDRLDISESFVNS